MLEYPGEAILAAGYEALRLLPEDDLARRGYARALMGCAYYLQLGDVQAAEQAFQDALPLTRAAGDTFSQLQIYTHLSQMRAIRGQLGAAEEACQELKQMAIEPGWKNVPAAGLGGVMHGRVLYERNDLPGALATLTAGITTLENFSLKRAEIIGCILLARVQLALGEMDQARGTLDRAWNMIQKYNLKQITMPAAAYRARLLLQMGDLETAARWAATVEQQANDPLNPALEYDHITLARVYMAQGRLDEAQELLARLLPPAEEAGRMARVIEILVLQVMVAYDQQDGTRALTALKRALILAEPEGFVRSFVDEGAPTAALLRQLRAQGLHLAYVNKLLAAFPAGAAASMTVNPLPESLSEREMEVLRLVATGASNKDIADQLFIALSTAKKHVSNILVKLDTPNRTQAVARASELALLP
jgi:LuxR family maltose regulon positive regulatory protein